MGRFNRAALKVAFAIGKLTGVEKKLDTYRDFYITSYELVNPANVHPKQLELLAKDPLFKDKKCYVATATNADVQRRFILNEGQAKKIGLLNLKEGQAVGKAPQIILNERFALETHGQYLEKMLGYNLAKIYPRVQNLKTQADEIEEINKNLQTRKVKQNLVFRFWSKTKNPSP